MINVPYDMCSPPRLWALLVFLLAGGGSLQAQPALQHADLDRCTLENGAVIQNCQIGYRTAGTLNAEHSNAVLIPTWFSGTSDSLADQLGPDGLVDTTRYFVVLVDALGNGVSSSPSTSNAHPDSTFPVFTVRDMVDTQHRLLTETLGIDSLHAVLGTSMGGMQAFAWMTHYPSFMDKGVSITGTPRLTPQDHLLWRAQLRALDAAPADTEGLRSGMKAVAAIHALHLRTPRQVATMDSTEFEQFVTGLEEDILAYDPYDWAWQIKAMLRHDVSKAFDGSMSAAADAIEADALIVTVEQDHMVNPIPAQRFGDTLGAEQLVLDTPCGHLGPGCESDTLNPTVRRFLRDQ